VGDAYALADDSTTVHQQGVLTYKLVAVQKNAQGEICGKCPEMDVIVSTLHSSTGPAHSPAPRHLVSTLHSSTGPAHSPAPRHRPGKHGPPSSVGRRSLRIAIVSGSHTCAVSSSAVHPARSQCQERQHYQGYVGAHRRSKKDDSMHWKMRVPSSSSRRLAEALSLESRRLFHGRLHAGPMPHAVAAQE